MNDDAPSEISSLPADVGETLMLRWRNFARHMAACENQTRAAKLAGYADSGAANQGYRLMQNPAVVAMVQEERQARLERLLVNDQRIIDAYAAIALGDARRVAQWRNDGTVDITPSEELTDDELLLVAGIERTEKYDKEGQPIVTLKVKLQPRLQALDALGRIRGLFKDKIEVDLQDGLAKDMADLRARRRARQGAGDGATIVDAVVVENDSLGGDFQGAAGRPSEPNDPAPASAGVNAFPSHAASAAGPSGEGSEPGSIQPGIARRFIASLPKEDGDGVAGS